MMTITTTDVIDFDSPEFQAAKADLEQQIVAILAKRDMKRSQNEISDIAWDILFECYQATIMPPPDVPKGKRGPKPNPATPMVGVTAAMICEKYDLGPVGAWEDPDFDQRSVAADIYRLVFTHVKQHIDQEYRGRHQDARYGLQKGKESGIKINDVK